ncbi:MAG: hypothetical protein ACK4U0_01015 [Mesorhizobium sp.]
MFGLFSRGRQQNRHVAMLGLADPAYAAAMRELFAGMDSSARAHVLVAHHNLSGAVARLPAEGRKQPDRPALETFIPIAAARMADSPDDIDSRRWSWFLFAALLARLEKIATDMPAVAQAGAEIWCAIAADSPRLKQLLPGNVIWKPQEKADFDLELPAGALMACPVGRAWPRVFPPPAAGGGFAGDRGLHLPGQGGPDDGPDGAA